MRLEHAAHALGLRGGASFAVGVDMARRERPVAEAGARPRARASRTRSPRPRRRPARGCARACRRSGSRASSAAAHSCRQVDPRCARARRRAPRRRSPRPADRPRTSAFRLRAVAARDRPRRPRPRTRRSSPRSPADARRAETRSAPRRASASAGSRRRTVTDSRRPHHSSSGRSWSKASASSDPSTSSQSRFLRPAEIWLITAEPRAPPSVSNWTTAASSVVDRPRLALASVRGERLAAGAADTLGDRGQKLRREADDAVARDELGEIAPVRADVRERARGAAQVGVDAPVVVVGPQEPVLQVACRAGAATRRSGRPTNALARLAHGRVVAVDERDGGDEPGLVGRVDERCAPPARSSAIGFSQITCLPAARAARPSGTCRWFGVQMWTTSTSGEATSSSAESKARSAPSAPGGATGGFGRRRGDADYAGAGETGRARVDGTDEAGSCDRRAEGRHRGATVKQT